MSNETTDMTSEDKAIDRLRLTFEKAVAYDALQAENARLRAAIVAHRSQKADDRCIEDDDRLYEALGDGIKCDRRVGDQADMLMNCARFIGRRCEGGGWPSYVELEAELATVKAENERLRAQVAEGVEFSARVADIIAAFEQMQKVLRKLLQPGFMPTAEQIREALAAANAVIPKETP